LTYTMGYRYRMAFVSVAHLSKVLKVSSGVTVIVGFLSLVAVSTLLRPLADDYAFGATAADGFWNAIYVWWSGHSGDIFLVFVWVLVVGMPLVWLPMGLTSSVSFLLAGAFVGGLGLLALGLTAGLSRWRILTVWVVLTLGWWIHLWVRELVFPSFENLGVAAYLTHWQTVNVAYVIVPALHFVMFLLLLRGRLLPGRFEAVPAVFLGLILGTSGYVVAVSLGVFAFLIGVGKWVISGLRSSLTFFVYSLGALAGVLISLNGPGTQARRQSLPDLEAQTFVFSAIRTAPTGISNWLEIVFSFEILFAVCIGMLTAWFVGNLGDRAARQRRALETVLFLAPLSLLFAVVTAVSELAAYEADWHLTSTKLLVFVWSTVLGHVLYFLLHDFLGSRGGFELPVWVGKVSILASILGLVTAGTVAAAGAIVDRHIAWESGDAPVRWAQDKEADWLKPNWEKIEEFRTGRGAR